MADDTPSTILDIFNEVSNNLADTGLRWFSSDDINNAIQDTYNKIVALLCPIERSTFIPMLSEPYYDMRQIPDYMYISGIFNPQTNLWLEGLTYKQMKATYQTYLAIGQPRWINIVDLYRILTWPYLPTATGVLYVLYKASAPIISNNHIPILPYSVGPRLLEYFTTAELMEQAREFKKAQLWWDRALLSNKANNGSSIYMQCKKEIQNLARMDRENVLEPYRWIFHGGQFTVANWINNEIPSGTIDGSNPTFTIAQVPNPTSSLLIMKNGVIMFQNEAITLSGRTVTFNTNFIPQLTDVLRAWYQVA